MHCPFCSADDTKVIDSRLAAEGSQVRRRRECVRCGERFTTFETAELVMPRVVKSDGTVQPFDESKIRKGIMLALQKRPVSMESIDASLHRVLSRLRATGEREVRARMIGELLMEELRQLDQVAYVRFASVYRNFDDLAEFRTVLDHLDGVADEPS